MEGVYILALTNGKWYVGRSADIYKRIEQHRSGYGSEWTKLYKMIRVQEIIATNDPFDEDKYVKKYMLKYGIDNVRGGSYSQLIIPDYQLQALDAEFRGTSDQCFNCGETGHFKRYCPNRIDSNMKGSNISTSSVTQCLRCGRNSHTIDSCYAKTDIDGNPLEQSKVDCIIL